MGDLGGIFELFIQNLGFFLLPISEHSFFMSIIQKLFLAYTKEDDIFKTDKQNKNEEKVQIKEVAKVKVFKERNFNIKKKQFYNIKFDWKNYFLSFKLYVLPSFLSNNIFCMT